MHQPGALPGTRVLGMSLRGSTCCETLQAGDRDDVVYQAVVSRRLQWDNLVWQVPLLSLTAQAFLFTIALAGDTSRTARVIAAGLSLIVTFLSITLMARHRQAEIADAHWLEAYEDDHFSGMGDAVHGRAFQARRNTTAIGAGRVGRMIPMRPGFATWVIGLAGFGVAALIVLVVTIFWPTSSSPSALYEPEVRGRRE